MKISKSEEGSKVDKDLEELYNPLRLILSKLEKEIRGKKYKMIIGAEAIGRIPTLILLETLKKLWKPKPGELNVHFFVDAGHIYKGDEGRVKRMTESIKSYLLKRYYDKISQDNFRVLIVTENIITGESLTPITTALSELGVKYDIATVGTLLPNSLFLAETSLKGRIIYGSDQIPRIDEEKRYDIAGVRKKKQGIFSEKIHGGKELEPYRKQMSLLAQRLAASFKRSNIPSV